MLCFCFLYFVPFSPFKFRSSLTSRLYLELPGLSSYQDRPIDAAASLTELLEFAKLKIPMKQWQTTPVYLKATAGLRSVPADKAERVLERCRDMFAESPFRFERDWARVISGTEEGLMGWVGVNYLSGNFDSDHHAPDTLGVIEVGGASVQVTFIPDDDDHTMEMHEVKLGSRTFQVYTHSYLGYGLEAATDTLTQKMRDLPHIDESLHPCFPKETDVAEGITGDGHPEKCESLITNSLFSKDSCPAHTSSNSCPVCTFNGVCQPRIRSERFIAIENFFYTSEFFDIDKDAKFLDLMEEKGREFCKLKWEEAKQKYINEPESDLVKYCFSSLYLTSLINDGLGIEDHLEKNIEVKRKIAGQDIDWAVGAALVTIMEHGSEVDTDPTPTDSTVEKVDILPDPNKAPILVAVHPFSKILEQFFVPMSLSLVLFVFAVLVYMLRHKIFTKSLKTKALNLLHNNKQPVDV